MSTEGRSLAASASASWAGLSRKPLMSAWSAGFGQSGEGDLLVGGLEARAPATGAEAGGAGAVVDHVGDVAGVHVRQQRVDRLDDRLVDDLRPRVTALGELVDLRDHRGHEQPGGERVDQRPSSYRDGRVPSRRTPTSGEPPIRRHRPGGEPVARRGSRCAVRCRRQPRRRSRRRSPGPAPYAAVYARSNTSRSPSLRAAADRRQAGRGDRARDRPGDRLGRPLVRRHRVVALDAEVAVERSRPGRARRRAGWRARRRCRSGTRSPAWSRRCTAIPSPTDQASARSVA